jgi:hypothetical protein
MVTMEILSSMGPALLDHCSAQSLAVVCGYERATCTFTQGKFLTETDTLRAFIHGQSMC